MKNLSNFLTEARVLSKNPKLDKTDLIMTWLNEHTRTKNPKVRAEKNEYVVDADRVYFTDPKLEDLTGGGLFRWGTIKDKFQVKKLDALESIGEGPEHCKTMPIEHCKNLRSLSGLKTKCDGWMWVVDCPNLESLDCPEASTEEFHAENCPKLKSLDGFPTITNPWSPEFEAWDCGLRSLKGLPDNIEKLTIGNCDIKVGDIPVGLVGLYLNGVDLGSLDNLPLATEYSMIFNANLKKVGRPKIPAGGCEDLRISQDGMTQKECDRLVPDFDALVAGGKIKRISVDAGYPNNEPLYDSKERGK